MLANDNNFEFGTLLALYQYEELGCPNGKTIKGLSKWFKLYLREVQGKFFNKNIRLNRKCLKNSIRELQVM
jgi:hypothetical protein